MPVHILFGMFLWKQILYFLKSVLGMRCIDYITLKLLHMDFSLTICHVPMGHELEDAVNPQSKVLPLYSHLLCVCTGRIHSFKLVLGFCVCGLFSINSMTAIEQHSESDFIQFYLEQCCGCSQTQSNAELGAH